VRTEPRLTDGVAPRAKRVEQFLAVLLFEIERACRPAARTDQQQCETGPFHDTILSLHYQAALVVANPLARSEKPRSSWFLATDTKGIGAKIMLIQNDRAGSGSKETRPLQELQQLPARRRFPERIERHQPDGHARR